MHTSTSRSSRRNHTPAARPAAMEALEHRRLYSVTSPSLEFIDDIADPDAGAPADATFIGTFRARSRARVIDAVGGGFDAEDYYRLDLSTDAALKVKLGRLQQDVSLEVLDASGNSVDESDNADNLGESLRQNLPAGTYLIRVADEEDGEGFGTRYQLVAQTARARGPLWQPPAPAPEPPPPGPGPTPENFFINGELSEGDRTFGDGTRFDAYRFTAAADGTARITLRSDAFIPYIDVVTTDANGVESILVANTNPSNINGGGVDFPITAGTEYLVRVGQKDTNVGAYSLECSPECQGIAPVDQVPPAPPAPPPAPPAPPPAPPPPPPVPPPPPPVPPPVPPVPPVPDEIGAQVFGELAIGDGALGDGSFFDVYTFDASVDGTAAIFLSSTRFTPRVSVAELTDAGAAELATDENVDGDALALVQFTVRAGQRYGVLSSSAGPASGEYALEFTPGLGPVLDENGNRVDNGGVPTPPPAPPPPPPAPPAPPLPPAPPPPAPGPAPVQGVAQAISGRQYVLVGPPEIGTATFGFAPDFTGLLTLRRGGAQITLAFSWQVQGTTLTITPDPAVGGEIDPIVFPGVSVDPVTRALVASDGTQSLTLADDGPFTPTGARGVRA